MRWQIDHIGTRCRDLLLARDGDRIYRLHAVFRRSVHFMDEAGEILCTVAPEIGAGPCQLTINAANSVDFAPGRYLQAGEEMLWDSRSRCLASPKVSIDLSGGRIWETSLFRNLTAKKAADALQGLRGIPPFSVPDPTFVLLGQQLVLAVKQRNSELFSSVALRLLGRGNGLTPTGDDMLFGFYSGLLFLRQLPGGTFAEYWLARLRGLVQQYAGERTTPVSASLLTQLVKDEQCAQKWSDLLEAYASAEAEAVKLARLGEWLTTGHTSGKDTLFGLRLALQVASSLLNLAPDVFDNCISRN